MRTMTAWLVAIAAAAALVVTGCGSSAASTSNAATGDGAGIVPANAAAFIAVDSDLSSSQWADVKTLLDKFPGKDKALAMLKASFERSSSGITWADVRSALGPEVDVAVFLKPTPYVIGMTKPNDTSAFDSLVRKGNASGGSQLHVADYKGWKIFSNKQANLDAFEQGGAMLADDATYKDANGKLAGAAIAKAYASGTQLFSALTARALPLKLTPAQTQANGTVKWIAADLVAQSDGAKLDVRAKTTGGAAAAKAYAAKLPSELPGGALAYLSFSGESFRTAGFQKTLQGLNGIPQAAQLLPVLRQLAPIFAHENAIYVRQAGVLPEVTLVAQPDSPQTSVAAIDSLVGLASLGTGTKPKVTPVTIGSIHAKELNLGRFSIFYGAVGGKVVVSNSQQAFDEVGGSGQKLADDANFKEAEKAAGMPSTTDGFVYLNLKDSIPLLESLAQLGNANIPPQLTANLRPLRSVLAWATSSGGEGDATLFLEVK